MNTFLIKYEKSVLPCFGIEKKGLNLCALVKNYEIVHKTEMLIEDGYFDIDFANESDLLNSLQEVEQFFDHVEIGTYYEYKYPSKDQFVSLLDEELYFQMIIKKIVSAIDEKVIVDLDTITWDCIKYQYNRILNDYKVKI